MKINENTLIEPYNFRDIFKFKDKIKWLKKELEIMKNLNVYKIVKTIPSGSNIILSRWIFKYKRDASRNVITRKARLVAKGYTRQYGIDYKETFAPTLKQDTVRIITVIAVQKKFQYCSNRHQFSLFKCTIK